MYALDVSALLLSVVALWLSVQAHRTLGQHYKSLKYLLERQINSQNQSFSSGMKSDLPAYARTPDGPSGHAFHGHPHVEKTPGACL